MVSRLFFYSAAVAALVGVAAAPKAHAAAFYLQDQSVKGLGRAYSGEVSDTGAESLWWNPASIAGSGRELYVGAQGLMVSSTVADSGSSITRPIPPRGLTTPTGGDPRSEDVVSNGIIPNFAFAMPIGDRFALGLSAAAPYDFTSRYESTSFARYDSTKTRLTTEDLQLTGAMKATSWLDLGVGFSSEYTSADLGQAYPNLSPLLPDGQSHLKGNGWNYGYSAGARVHFDRWSIGASYRSAMDHDLDGSVAVSGLLAPLSAANNKSPGKAQFRTPWIATFGGCYALTDKLTFDAQIQRFGWSEFSGIYVTENGETTKLSTNYHDTTSEAIGVDYKVTDLWTMRAGFGYDQTPTPNVGRTSLVPDSNRHLYTIGTSLKVTPKMTLDAAAGYIQFDGSNVNNTSVFYGGTPAATSVTEKASVAGNAKLLSVGMRYNF